MRVSGAAAVVRLAAMIAVVSAASPARGDITHVVQRGHTIEAIAHRYRVSVKAIVEANHLKDTNHLKPGQTIVIPAAEGSKKGLSSGASAVTHPAAVRAATPPREVPPAEARERGASTIHAIRLGEEFCVHVKDAKGHIPPSALKTFERLLRQGNATHPIDPRLVALVGIVSSHFGSKPIEVVSGYRPYTPTQYTPHSNHNYGKAIDFHVVGVSDEAVRDFCITLRSAGCGYYPNNTFIHMDVRDTKAYWVDWSRPGEPPKYDRPGVAADEGVSDVPEVPNEKTPSVAARTLAPLESSPSLSGGNPPELVPLPAPQN